MQMGFAQTINACEITSKPTQTSKRIKAINNTDDIRVYPNPTQGNLTVNLDVEKGNNVLFELFDVIGKKQESLILREGSIHQLNLSTTHHGIYFYRLINNKEILKSGKLIIE